MCFSLVYFLNLDIFDGYEFELIRLVYGKGVSFDFMYFIYFRVLYLVMDEKVFL